MSYKQVGKHKCVVQHKLDTVLPTISPKATKWERIVVMFRNATMPSYRHPQTKYYFKSHNSLIAEKYRILLAKKWYLVHPFSVLAIIREITMSIIYGYNFIRFAYRIAFYTPQDYSFDSFYLYEALIILLLLFVNIILNFMMGFLHGTYVCLERRKIVRRYLKSYFILDLIDASSIGVFYSLFATNPNPTIVVRLLCLHMLEYLRLMTFYKYCITFLNYITVPDKYHGLIFCVFIVSTFVHNSTCFIYGLPRLQASSEPDLESGSYMRALNFKNKSNKEKYILCLHKVLCHFYRSGRGLIGSHTLTETITFIVVLIVSYGFNVYIVIYVLETVQRYVNPFNKFQTIWAQLQDYMKNMGFTPHLQYKVMLYYHYKFQNEYYREEVIMAGLSEHLRYEIILHCNSHVISQTHIMRGLPKHVIGNIIASVQQEIYLPNDVLLQVGDIGNVVFFISYGTLAYYTAEGDEVRHIMDGDLAGGCGLLLGKTPYTTTAVETTEVLRWKEEDIERMRDQFPEVVNKILIAAQERYNEDITSRKENIRDYTNQLKRGHILEKLTLRKPKV